MADRPTRGEKREHKRRKKRQMKVVGKSVRLIQEVIMKRADRLLNKERKGR